MDSEALLGGLNASQLEAVTTRGEPVVVLAGAGSGKTRVLTRRIAYRIVERETDPNRVMALTFTRKAAAELRSRLRSLGLRDEVPAGTFHGMALLQLRQRWAERGVNPPTLLNRKIRFVGNLLGSGQGRTAALDVTAELEWAQARMIDGERYPAAAAAVGRTPSLPAEQVAEILTRYQQEKRKRRVVDFDDLLMLTIRDLQNDPRYAEAIRWRYRHLYVDEFQDVNPLQYELLSQWRGDRPELFVVGDPNQAIYGWNGADPNLLGRILDVEPGATVVELVDNYRSSPQVLAVAGALSSGRPLTPSRGDGPVPTITAYPNDRMEAAGIADRIREAHSVAGDWSDQAVLVRTNAQLVLIEQELSAAGIPVRLRGGSGPLATPEVKTELKLLTRPGVDLVTALGDLDARLDEPTPGNSVTAIEHRANLAAFVRLIHDYMTSDPLPTGLGLDAWIGTLQAGDVEQERDAVDLSTFHASKGLEWDVVHIAGLEDGFVPIAYASTGAQLAEEKRLLYVAVTRAMSELHLSWAAERTFTTKPVTRQPSTHLNSLAERIARLGVGPVHRVDWKTQIAKSRRSLQNATGSAAPPNGSLDNETMLYEELKRWRQTKARAADVPPHVVFNDQTLRAIASARPSTTARLASMPGMRPAKLHRYGADLLQVVAETGGLEI